ncbi:MAG: glycoside hydrolase family 5 protein [Bacteroidales bacterium]|nr:glycoside hydrolase family 5 protein [Bacteroidales bacterium]
MKVSRYFAVLILLTALASCSNEKNIKTLPEVDHKDLSNLHGFNLLEKFTSGWQCEPYLERDFQLISDYGFNFVRLPMDYRCITEPGKWDQLSEGPMEDLDQAIEFGEKYGIHVCINLHHAPGYCINARDLYSPDSSLWTGKSAQDAFVSLWRQMAERYKGISNDNVSFNLLNEPVGTSKEAYLEVAIRAIEAIREVDPDRLIMSDGWNVGRDPIPELAPYDVVQMFRGYWPMSITHCGANWTNNEYGPDPEWPSNQYLGQHIRAGGEGSPGIPLTVKHHFAEETPAEIIILRVCGPSTMEVRSGVRVIFERSFDPESDEVVAHETDRSTGTKTGVYLDTMQFAVPAGTKELTVHAVGGEWITFGRLSLFTEGAAQDPVVIIPGNVWSNANEAVLLKEGGFVTENAPNADWDSIYRQDHLEPWINFMNEHNIGIMVGEWGVYERAPREVTMEWMEYMLETWQEYDLGWAMWNFRGSFGVAENNRRDTEFTEVDGLMMDEEMLKILKEAISE